MAIRWEEPPPARPGRHKTPARAKHAAFADALRGRPGEWALLTPDGGNSLAAAIKKGKLRGFEPAGAFEAVGRRDEKSKPGRSRVYVRYVGEEA